MAMRGGIPVPGRGERMLASWGAAVAERVNELCSMAPAGMMARDGLGGMGAEPLPQNRRNRRTVVHSLPFEVRFAADIGEEGAWIIWLPTGSLLLVGGEGVDLTAELDPVGEPYPDGWYVLDFLGDGDGSVYLNVHIPSGGTSDDEGEGDTPSANFSADEDESEEGEIVLPVLIAEISGRDVKQNVTSAITLGGADGIEPDGASVDANGGEEGGRIQIAHFNDSEKDSGKGLASRLKADPETGEITASDGDSVMLVARKGGKVIYIPLSGDGEDPDDPGEDASNPCSHPGDPSPSGGVDPSAEGGFDPSPSGGGVHGVAGGVAADGDAHPGDDDCNCDK